MSNLENLATGQVASAPSPATSGTSLDVQTGEGDRYPATPFLATAHPADQMPDPDNAEIIEVTNVSSDTLTIVRAQEGSSAKSIDVGWRITNAIYKSDWDAKVETLSDLGVTASASELNTMDGITATTTELNYTDGVTSAIQTQIDGKQPLDSDLTAIAAISPSNDDVIQRKAGAWTNRTPAQLKTDLSLTKSDVGLGNVDNTSDATKNSASVTLTSKTIALGSNTITGTTAQFNTALTDNDFATLAGSETLTNKTLTSPVINTGISGTAFLDEDDMSSDSATKVASQQSIKAYVDSKASSQSLVRNEVPSGSINGSNTAFTLASTPATGSLRLYKNGVRLKVTDDYTISGTTITMVTAPATDTKLLADYEVRNSAYSVGTNSFISDETPTGSVNSSNTSFTTARAYIAGSLEVFVNGVKQARTTHYTETTPSSGSFTMSDAPTTGDVVRVNYQYNLNPSSNADTVDGIHANTVATASNLMPLDSNGKFDWSVMPSGSVIQMAATNATTSTTGTGTIPLDDTIPQNTEGDQYMTLSFTPKSATSTLYIEVMFVAANNNTAYNMIAALFKDSDANAMAANAVYGGAVGASCAVPIGHSMTSGTTSSITFKVRGGANLAGTTTFNGAGGSRFFNTISKSYIKITEVKA